MSENDDFWTTYIAATPEEDRHFAGCARWLWYLAGLVLGATTLAAIWQSL